MTRKALCCNKCNSMLGVTAKDLDSIEIIDSETKMITCGKCGYMQLFKPIKYEVFKNKDGEVISFRYIISESE